MSNSVEVPLGNKAEVISILRYVTDDSVDDNQKCALGFCQSLIRDLKYASWAEIQPKKDSPDQDDWWMRITSPVDDVSAYAEKVPAFMAAAKIGEGIYQANKAAIDGDKLFFFPMSCGD